MWLFLALSLSLLSLLSSSSSSLLLHHYYKITSYYYYYYYYRTVIIVIFWSYPLRIVKKPITRNLLFVCLLFVCLLFVCLFAVCLFQTRVLVTHGISFLPQVDHIVVLGDGEISEVRTFELYIKLQIIYWPAFQFSRLGHILLC